MYDLIIGLYALIARLISPFHKKAGLMVHGQKQTFRTLREKRDPHSKYIWFHAASLGEFEQGRPMMEKIKKESPEYKILLTFFSPSGYEIRKNYEGADIVCYLPFDFYKNAKRFLDLASPSLAIFIKYEFWMNYLNQLRKRNIPTYLISAIFRPDQIFFKPYASNYRGVLKDFNWLFVQDQNSLDLLKKYNILNTSISGDTRFDRVYEIYNQQKAIPSIEQFLHTGERETDFTLIAGSSWPKDEELFISYFNKHPEMKLIIAPHEIHEEHIQYIVSRLKRPYALLSGADEMEIAKADCLIIDSFGLLSSIYRYGNAAYIGGGFGEGIHNILEAAVYGIPVIFGPNHQKFKEANDLIGCNGGFSIKDDTSFNQLMDDFLADKGKLIEAGKQAENYVKRSLGATTIILDKIVEDLQIKP